MNNKQMIAKFEQWYKANHERQYPNVKLGDYAFSGRHLVLDAWGNYFSDHASYCWLGFQAAFEAMREPTYTYDRFSLANCGIDE